MTEGKGQFVFIENHDTDRFAHAHAEEPAILKLGAAVNLLVGWTPIIYYGQEIGMTGAKAEGPEAEVVAASGDDARDIPVRQAFRWSPDEAATGHAIWYRSPAEAYPLPDSNMAGDGRSVAEQEGDPEALLSYYRDLSVLRAAHPALSNGRTDLVTQDEALLVIERRTQDSKILIAFNFSDTASSLSLPTDVALGDQILGPSLVRDGSNGLVLPPYSALAWVAK